MTSEELVILAKLTPRPYDFDATVRVDQLHHSACEIIESSKGREIFIEDFSEISLSNIHSTEVYNSICLAAQAALQQCVEMGLLDLNVLPPNGGRFLQLPANSLFPGGAGPDCFSSENNSNYPWHLADTAWRTGYFGLLDGGFELGALHRLGLQVFVSEKQAKAAFDALRGWLELAAEGSSLTPFQNPDSDEAVDMTIRRLVMERDGHLPLNDGAKYVIQRHPTRRRDEIRKRIAAITKPTRSGPVRPRNRAAKKI